MKFSRRSVVVLLQQIYLTLTYRTQVATLSTHRFDSIVPAHIDPPNGPILISTAQGHSARSAILPLNISESVGTSSFGCRTGTARI